LIEAGAECGLSQRAVAYGSHSVAEVDDGMIEVPVQKPPAQIVRKSDRWSNFLVLDAPGWIEINETALEVITAKRIRRGAYASVGEFKAAIHDYLERRSAEPKPFIWTKTADAILARRV
jgi:hypothetical protein